MTLTQEDNKVLNYFRKRRSRTGDRTKRIDKYEGYIARFQRNKIINQTIQTLLDPTVANRGAVFFASASALDISAEAFAMVLIDRAKSRDKLAIHHYLKPFVGNLSR